MNLLITGAWRDAKEHLAEIEKMGHSVVFMQYEKDDVPCDKEWVEGIICNDLFSYHDIDSFTNLKYIQLTSAGTDRVPMKYIEEHNIEIHNASGVYSVPMAEFAIGAVLQVYKDFRTFGENQKLHKWEKNRSLLELTDKTVCIVGCGSVGTECAKRFKAFGCNVYGINRSGKTNEAFDKVYSHYYINEILKEADIVVIAVPLNDETRYLIDEEKLSFFKDGCVIVNIARGAVVDNQALIKHLERSRIYAVLDVFEEEPLSEHSKLWNLENVIITPHNSFVGDGNGKRMYKLITDNLNGLGQ